MNLIEFLERLGKGASRMIWWVALMGAGATAGVAYLWWQSGQMVGALITALVGAACVLPAALLAALSAVSLGQNEVLKPFRPGAPAADEPRLTAAFGEEVTRVGSSYLPQNEEIRIVRPVILRLS